MYQNIEASDKVQGYLESCTPAVLVLLHKAGTYFNSTINQQSSGYICIKHWQIVKILSLENSQQWI